ncbi:MAG TPA: TonB-dependent receptor, partial [Pyrinomonadaceae bacterium]
NGASIVGATITATQIEKNIERTVVTDEEGRYRIIELQPGTYKIRAASQGFGAKERIDLVTIAGQNVQLDFALAPAGVQAEQTVTVGGDDAPDVDTTRTVVGGTVTQREIEELPNPTRNPFDLVFTLGGVTEEALSTRDLADDKSAGRSQNDTNSPSRTPEEAGVFALSGGAAYSNNITIDGFDNNDDRGATFRFQPSVESIDEVQVITNQFSAEYGRASGGRVNIRTRAGARRLRGRAYYFFRDESLNANTWRNNSRGVGRPAFQQNIPGFTLGGPIPVGYFKNKTFFFTALEYDNIYDIAQTDTYVPVTQNPRFPIPAPTNPGQTFIDFGATLGRYLVNTETPRKNIIFSARLDHNFTDTQTLTLSYQLGRLRDERQFYGGNSLPDALIGRQRDTDALNAAFNSVFSPKAVNQFRFQYSVLEPHIVAPGQDASSVVLISFREPGRTSNTSLTAGSSSLGASDRREKRLQFQDSFNYIFGGHSLKLGGDLQSVDSTYIDLTDASGTYNFATPVTSTTVPQCRTSATAVVQGGVNAFLANCVVRYRHNFFTDSTQKNTYYGMFLQDDWRATSNLTMSFGARYERETIIDDKNNWSPRFAVAWDPFKKGTGV